MTCCSPILVAKDTPDERLVPCGKCEFCKANKRNEWCGRLKAEHLASKFALFCTFTYSDDNLPICEVDVSGERKKKAFPDKKGFQRFLKRLRKSIGFEKLRYFAISEYGETTMRPHAHAIFFFRDVELDKVLYDKITAAWSAGFVEYGTCTDASIAYCTNYMMKPDNCPFGINDNWLLSSRRPALGDEYMERQFIDCRDRRQYHRAQLPGGIQFRMPRLYRDRFLSRIDEDDAEDIKLGLRGHALEAIQKDYNEFHRRYPNASAEDFIYWRAQKQKRQSELMAKHIDKHNRI